MVGAEDDCNMAAMCCKYQVFMSSLLGVAVVVVGVVVVGGLGVVAAASIAAVDIVPMATRSLKNVCMSDGSWLGAA